MAFTTPSRLWNSSEAKCISRQMASRSCRPRSVFPSEYSAICFSPSSPSSSTITRRAISSMSELDLEKFRYLHAYMIGGQALRICTSFAPFSYRKSTVSRICVPRTMESSTNSSRFPWISSCTGICFIRAILSRSFWVAGMKLRLQVGVYLMNARAKCRPLWFA